MAEIDRLSFGFDVFDRLDRDGLSYADACAAHPDLDKAMLSRACNGATLSAANFLVVCRAFGLDPFAYLAAGRRRLSLKDIAKQAVTRADQRETREARP